MVEFLQKFQNRGIKIARVNSILITKSINLQKFTLILYGDEVCCDRRRFSVHSQFIEKCMPKRINFRINASPSLLSKRLTNKIFYISRGIRFSIWYLIQDV